MQFRNKFKNVRRPSKSSITDKENMGPSTETGMKHVYVILCIGSCPLYLISTVLLLLLLSLLRYICTSLILSL